MTLKTIRLIYKGRGIFTTKQKLSLHRGQAVRAYLGPTPWTDATRGLIKIPQRLAKRLAEEPELGAVNS
jgi:hypothetical protein